MYFNCNIKKGCNLLSNFKLLIGKFIHSPFQYGKRITNAAASDIPVFFCVGVCKTQLCMIYFHWLMTLLQYRYLGKFMSVLHHHLSIMHSFVTLKRKKLITFRRKLNPFWGKNKSMKYPVYTLRLVYIQPKNHAVLYMI